MMTELTKSSIWNLLQSSDRAVERAVIVLFERQTDDEQSLSLTRHDNQRGFSAAHASKGSYYARWIRSGRHLTAWHLQNARKIVQHYTGQLLEAAQEKKSRDNVGRRETADVDVNYTGFAHSDGYKQLDFGDL